MMESFLCAESITCFGVYDGFSFANLQECYSTALIQSRLIRDPLKDPTNHDACLLPLRIPGTQPLNFCPFCS